MILCTHAVVGGAIASLMPHHPALAFCVGIASHFAIDAIPHGDYTMRSISLREGRPALALNPLLIRDLAIIAFDGLFGLALTAWLYATPGSWPTVLLGALGGMLPDPLQILQRLLPVEPLMSIQRVHIWAHTKRQLDWPLAIVSQPLFVLVVIFVVEVTRPILSLR